MRIAGTFWLPFKRLPQKEILLATAYLLIGLFIMTTVPKGSSGFQAIRLMVLHPDPILEAGLRSLLGRFHDIEVVKTSDATGRRPELTDVSLLANIDVLIADYDEGMKVVSNAPPGSLLPKIVMLTSNDRACDVHRALECGIRSYLLTGCDVDELVAAVRQAESGALRLSPAISQRLVENLYSDSLTTRELDVLAHVIKGSCNKVVAKRLGIAEGTVKSHLRSIFPKLNVRSRAQAIVAVDQLGLLPRGPVERLVAAV